MSIVLKKILCPTDFSENSEHAMKYALALATLSQAQLELFHDIEEIAATTTASFAIYALLLIVGATRHARGSR